MVASPRLSEEDIDAIKKGYELRKDVVERVLINSLTSPANVYEEERLNLLVNYIADEKLDIKIALLEKNNEIGIYHEKLGLMYDKEENVVAFTGSMNETANGMEINYETLDETIEIKPIGEVDIYTSPELKNKIFQLIDERVLNIIINGEGLEYIDSTGLGVLMSIYKKVQEKNLSLTINNLKPNIYKLFDITGLNKVFNIQE